MFLAVLLEILPIIGEFSGETWLGASKVALAPGRFFSDYSLDAHDWHSGYSPADSRVKDNPRPFGFIHPLRPGMLTSLFGSPEGPEGHPCMGM